MSKSRVDLINGALVKLKKLVSGETADFVSSSTVDALVDPLIANLNARGVIYIPDVDDIPDEAFDPLRRRLAWEAAEDFSVPLQLLPTCDPAVSESDLRNLSGVPANDGNVVEFEDF